MESGSNGAEITHALAITNTMSEPHLAGVQGPVSVIATVGPSGQTIVVQYADSSGNPTNVSGYSPTASEVVSVKAAAGTFTLSFGGNTTSALLIGSAAASVQAALAALPSIGSGNVTVTGICPYLILFAPSLSGTLTVSTSGLAATAAATPTTAGSGSNQFLSSIATGASQTGVGWAPAGGGSYNQCPATGTGLNSAKWVFTGLAVGNYQVYFASPHIAGPTVSTTTPIRYFDGTTYRGKQVVDQSSVPYPASLTGSTYSFEVLGTIYIASGTLTILVTDEVASGDIGKYVVADTFAVSPVDPTNYPILAHSTTPSEALPLVGFPNNYNPGATGWNQNETYAVTAGDQYEWIFLGLVPGTYLFQVTYASYPTSRSALASYQVYDGTTPIGSPVVVSQLVAPSGGLTKTDSFGHSFTFQNLGAFTITGSSAKLILTAGSDTAQSPLTATQANAALVSLQSVSGYHEPVSSNVAAFSTGPPTISINGGAPISLMSAIWSIPPSVATPIIVYPIAQTIQSTDVVKFSLSNNSVTTAAGIAPTITNQTAINKVGSHLVPAAPASKTMGLGWNLQLPGGNPVPLYANMAKNCSFPVYGGSDASPPAQTADLYPQFLHPDNWYLQFGVSPKNDTNTKGYPLWPQSGTTTIMWDGATGGRPYVNPAAGTVATILSEYSGQATNNKMLIALAVDGSGATYAPSFLLYMLGLTDFGDDADSGRTSTTGTWTPHTGSGWNGSYRTNDKLATSTFTWNFGALPAGTWLISRTWVASASNTKTATYKVYEGSTLLGTFTNDQTATIPPYSTTPDYNGVKQSFTASTDVVTTTGGVVTVVLSGGTDGYAVADAIWIRVVNNITSSTPFAPISNLRVYPPDPGINPANPPLFHPLMLNALKGSKSLRTVTLLGGNSGPMINYSDYTATTQLCYGSGARRHYYAITQAQNWSDPDGWFGGVSGTALFTITALNGAPLPLANGQPVNLPAGLNIPFASGGGVSYFASFETAIYYNPAKMATNQFAAAGYGTTGTGSLATMTPTPPATSLGSLQILFDSIPFTDYLSLVSSVPGCSAWINTTAVGNQSCMTSMANAYMAAMPVGSKVYVETGNEPWNYAQAYTQYKYYVGLSRTMFSNGSPMPGYGYISSQQHTWFYNALAANGRGNELVRVFNCQAGDVSTSTALFTWLNANNKLVDLVVIAPYFGASPAAQAALTSIYTALNAAQIVDCADAYLAYGNFYQQVLGSYQAAIATQVKTTGYPTALGGYEGGLASLTMGGTGSVQEYQAIGSRYHPQCMSLLTGFFAILQNYGFTIFNYFDLDGYPVAEFTNYETSTYGVYLAYGALAGKGDGSDGLHDNRPDIAGAPPTAPNLLIAVTPIGAAVNAWNGSGTTPPPTYKHARAAIQSRLNRSHRRLFHR